MRKNHRRERPVADRAREAAEDLGAGAPTVARLARDEEMDTAFAAGVTAAGESNRPAGTHVAPEYPTGEVAAEFDVDSVHTLDGDEEEPLPGERLDDLEERPEDPLPF